VKQGRGRSSSTSVAAVLCVGVITAIATGSSGLAVERAAQATGAGPHNRPNARVGPTDPYRESVALRWNARLLDAVRAVRFPPVMTARALAVVHTCMYDAWAAYDARAFGTVLGDALRRPPQERTLAAREVAVSYAAFAALVDLFPSQRPAFEGFMAELDADPASGSIDRSTPAAVGNAACGAVLAWRHHDGANQLGDMSGGAPYSDYTGYVPVNPTGVLVDPNRWQPLVTAAGQPQVFVAPHWRNVTPFALTAADQFRPAPPPMYPSMQYVQQADAIRRFSARLDDRQKVLAEYWADGPATETPPGHWSLLAQFVSRRDRHDLEADVKMFFALGNALLDASIAVWDCKVEFDYVRPVSAIRFLYAGQLIEAWGGPGLGPQLIRGEQFRSYLDTPPFAEYTSGHSAFSAASAAVLHLVTGSPNFGATYTFKAGSSTIEPGRTPARDVVLAWPTFDQAADEAGLSRRYGGIHYRQADLESRELGRRIGLQAWERARTYFGDREAPRHRVPNSKPAAR
jgi:membrane-associated phospholipid phosphatase